MLDDPPRASGGPRAARRRWMVRLLLAPVLVTGLSACAAATPLCDDAAALTEAARLGAAAEKYAEAGQRGEGECAETGLSASATRYVDAYVNVARGRSAETNRDVEAATAAYQAALTFDMDNAAARDGLARLGRPIPELRQTPAVSAPAAAPAAPSTLLVALAISAVTLLVVVLGLVLWTERRRRRDLATAGEAAAVAQMTEREQTREQARRALGEVQQAIGALAADLRGSAEEFRTGLRASVERDAVAATARADIDHTATRLDRTTNEVALRCASLERQLDEVIDYLGDVMRDQARPVHDRFARPES